MTDDKKPMPSFAYIRTFDTNSILSTGQVQIVIDAAFELEKSYFQLQKQLAEKDAEIKNQAKKILERAKQKIIARGEKKPDDFKVIDALLNEYDAVTAYEELQSQLLAAEAKAADYEKALELV